MSIVNRIRSFLITSIIAAGTALTMYVVLWIGVPLIMLIVHILAMVVVMALVACRDYAIGQPFTVSYWHLVEAAVIVFAIIAINFYREMNPPRPAA